MKLFTQNRGKVRLELHQPTIEKMLRSRKPERVFVCSMTDLFLADHPDEWLVTLFAVMALSPEKTFQVLTKRIERAADWLNDEANQERVWAEMSRLINACHLKGRTVPAIWPLPNVWLGTSVEDQAAADVRIYHLLRAQAALYFLSCEPLLGPVDLRHFQYDGIVEIDALTGHHGVSRPLAGRSDREVEWVIVGGESGPNARPMHPDWALDLRDQCREAGTPFFFKQHGEYLHESQYPDIAQPLDPDTWDHLPMPVAIPHREEYRRVGKKLAGRVLDGRTWDEYPEVRG